MLANAELCRVEELVLLTRPAPRTSGSLTVVDCLEEETTARYVEDAEGREEKNVNAF